MDNYNLLKKLIKLKELYIEDINKMNREMFLKNIKYNLETHYINRGMSNLTFYSLIKESVERNKEIESNHVNYSNQREEVLILLDDKIKAYKNSKWKILFRWINNFKKSEKFFMDSLINFVEMKVTKSIETKIKYLENSYREEVFEVSYENELEIEDIIHNWDTFEHFLREYLEFY